jgi:hypothetical protein
LFLVAPENLEVLEITLSSRFRFRDDPEGDEPDELKSSVDGSGGGNIALWEEEELVFGGVKPWSRIRLAQRLKEEQCKVHECVPTVGDCLIMCSVSKSDWCCLCSKSYRKVVLETNPFRLEVSDRIWRLSCNLFIFSTWIR